MTSTHQQLPDSIRLIDDMHLGREHVIATYVLLGAEPALVDPGPTSTLLTVEAGLAANGLTLGDIQTLLLTHIHLDHAGATGTIVARYPHIKVYVHERGAPHMIDPEKLLGSASKLYGDSMDYLWGEFRAVPAANMTSLAGGETLAIGGRTIGVQYAPGHASHHVVYHDQDTNAAFVGDVGGVRLPGSAYARPATPPPDVDLEAWNRSLDMVRDLDPQVLCLTHFGPVFDPQAHLAQYRERLWRWAEVVGGGMEQAVDETAQVALLQAQARNELAGSPEEAARYEQATPLFQSWQGLARYWKKRRS